MKKFLFLILILVWVSIFSMCGPPKTIAIKSPAGGEEWGVGIHTIEWSYLGNMSSFDIELIKPDETTMEIATDVEGSNNAGSYEWGIPLDQLEENSGYRIEISSGPVSEVSNEFSITSANWSKVADESELYQDFYQAVYNSDTGFNYEPRGIATAKVAPLGNNRFLAINFVVDTVRPSNPAATVIFSNSMMYYDGTQWVDDFWTHNTDLGSEPRANIAPIDTDTAIVFGGTDYPTSQDEVDKLSSFVAGDSALTEITNAGGTPPSARQEAIVTYCGSNKALVTLGFVRSGTTTVNIQLTSALFNYSTNSWEAASNISSDYSGLAMASAYAGGNKVVIYGGYGSGVSGTEVFNRTILYDADTDTFTELNIDPNPGPLAYASMTYIGSDDNGGVVLLFGGFDSIDFDDTGVGDTVSNKTWILRNDGTNWIWEELPTQEELTPRASSILYSNGDGTATLIGGRFDLKTSDEYDQQQPFEKDEWRFSFDETTNNELP